MYSDLYYKIDKYLENISKLNDKDYFLSLSTLIDKYGRKASDVNEDNEKLTNIYCRLGSKVIACKHNLPFIEYHKKLKTLDELNEEVENKYAEHKNKL